MGKGPVYSTEEVRQLSTNQEAPSGGHQVTVENDGEGGEEEERHSVTSVPS